MSILPEVASSRPKLEQKDVLHPLRTQLYQRDSGRTSKNSGNSNYMRFVKKMSGRCVLSLTFSIASLVRKTTAPGTTLDDEPSEPELPLGPGGP